MPNFYLFTTQIEILLNNTLFLNFNLVYMNNFFVVNP